MLKLYKQIDGELHYWETWDKYEKTGVMHWGKVGEQGNQNQAVSGIFSSFRKTVQKEIDKQLADGYRPIDEEHQYYLLIEYKIDGMGTEEDLDKRNRLQQRMDETLGWTGLGHCDGGSTGSGSMEICCMVVDFDIAKHVIENDLQGTEFAGYTRIFNENEE